MQMKERIKKYTPYWLGILGILASFFLFIGIFNANYQKIYHMPEVHEGQVDFSGYFPFEERFIGFNISGEWEFYYGTLLVEEGSDAEADGYISLPSSWTWKNFGKGALSPKGDASYRLTAKNIQAGQSLVFYVPDSDCNVKAYINRTLAYTRQIENSRWVETIIPYLCNGGDVELIIEVADSETGGICANPWVGPRTIETDYWEIVSKLPVVAIGLVLASFVFALLMSAGFFRYDRDYIQPILLCAIVVHLITDREIVTQLSINLAFAATIRLITGMAVILLLVIQMSRLIGLRPPKKRLVCYGGVFAATMLGTFLLLGTPVDIVFMGAFLLLALTVVPPFLCSQKIKTYLKGVYLTAYVLLFFTLCLEFLDMSGRLLFGSNYLTSTALITVVVIFALISFLRVVSATRNLDRIDELEKQLAVSKQNALSYQIEPHFVFNALNTIQDTYHKDMGEGDKALTGFSSYLRASAYKDRTALIPFAEELNNIQNYITLEKLRKNGDLNFYLNIETEDFKVPPFSIEPFIENAIKHGKLDPRNGYVSLTVSASDRVLNITVFDNGCGFDTENTTFGVGILNASERLQAQLNAELSIKSTTGEGTTITIIIPHK